MRQTPLRRLVAAVALLAICAWLLIPAPSDRPVSTSAERAAHGAVVPSAAVDPPRVALIPPIGVAGVMPGRDVAATPAPHWQALSLDVPSQAVHGGTIEASVGVAPGLPVRSAKFKLDYDAESLDLVEIVDAKGSALSAMPSAPGVIEMELLEFPPTRPPAARFVVRTDVQNTLQFTLSAELRDAAGNEISSDPVTRAIWVSPATRQ